jgi:putative cardiolipin synthase
MRIRTAIVACLLALGLCAASVSWLGTLPSVERHAASSAALATEGTRLGKAIQPLVDANPGLSGIYLLGNARDAFAARVMLAQAADRTLDVRYYIWHDDISGTLLFDALRTAADRGVRVRLLLDDNNTSGLDPILAALDAHPNIEVRLFNPFVIRSPRWIGYAVDFFRLNRRMHNKSFTADDQATIVGGRNVGDEYFGATNGVLFADLDVLAIGPVVKQVTGDFDRYWSSGSSYPVDKLLPPAEAAKAAELGGAAARVAHDPNAQAYLNAINESAFVRKWNERSLVPSWAATRMISDDPAKGLGRAGPETLMLERLREVVGDSAAQFDLVSPYFVPTEEGADALIALARRGVRIRVLTNALEATDVAVVHAGYAKRREELLRNGIALYEMRRRGPYRVEEDEGQSRFGSSGASLHAKTFAVDRSRIFVGSFNFDPRSARLNTEMGFVIDSPQLAQRIEAAVAARVSTEAFEVRLSEAGRLEWIEHREGQVVRYDTEPGTSVWKRARVQVLSLLPVEWLL